MPEDDSNYIFSPRDPRKEPITIDEAEKVLLERLTYYERGLAQTYFDLASLSRRKGHPERSNQYYHRLLAIADDPEKKAIYLLGIGCVLEKFTEYEEAIIFYSQALSLEPANDNTWYFINNNLGYCLNTIKKHGEAEPYCRAAIQIDPHRHNAYKNLGISMEGQGNFAEAARLYIKAVFTNPRDARALYLLEDLVSGHAAIGFDILNIQDQLDKCREVVKAAQRMEPGKNHDCSQL